MLRGHALGDETMKYVIAAAFALASLAAHSQELHSSGPYLGFGLGYLDYEENVEGMSLPEARTPSRIFAGFGSKENSPLEAEWGAPTDLKEPVSSAALPS